MKLYYAFSNTMVLTQANIQANVSKEEGDLLVWSTVPIDFHLVEIIRGKGIFRNVWYLDRPMILSGKNIRSRINSRRYKKKFYFEYLKRLLANQKYDEFITSGYWHDTLIILDYLKNVNPRIRIGVSEEGLLNYYCGYLHRNLYYMVQYTRKQRIRAYLLGGRRFRYVQKNIVADYLTAPNLMRQEVENEIYSLPAIDENNPIMKAVVDELFDNYQNRLESLIDEYRARKVCYIVTLHNKAYDPVDRSGEVLDLVLNEVPLEMLILKTHTNATQHRRTFGSDLDPEVLFSHIGDIENKVFIVRNSSIAIYLTQMFKIEPIFIFIHRLYSRYHYGWDDCGDFYVEDLKKNMKHPERILVPDSYVELKVILEELCREREM